MTPILLALTLLAQPHTVAVPCENVRILDGDTVRADLRLSFGVTIRDKTLRAADYDAWELSRHRQTVNVTDVELVRGREAKAALEQLVSQGQLHAEDTGKQDAYGRLLAVLWAKRGGEWLSVAEFMEAGYHVRGPP
jgi:endonuclease YncB( thermonuclease family)